MNGKTRRDDLLTLGAALDETKLALYGARSPEELELAWRNYRRANAAYIAAAMGPARRYQVPPPKHGPMKGRRRLHRQTQSWNGDSEGEQLGLALAG
jgi:hypothetical protein